MDKVNVFWHRRDLRYIDNVGLYYALDSEEPVLPVFIFDKNILNELDDPADARVTFIHDQIAQLDEAYRRSGGGLRVFYDTPKAAFEQLMEEYDLAGVYTNRDYEPYARQRDQEIKELLASQEIPFYSFKDQVVFEQGEILTDQEEPYKVFTPYKNKWLAKLAGIQLDHYNSEQKLAALYAEKQPAIPSLKDIGFSRTDIELPNAEVRDELLANYASDRDYPAKEGTSRLGVHLRFGTISIRELVLRAQSISDTFLNELIWREFYMMILAHYPHVVDRAFKPKYDQIPWINDEEQFEKWCQGKTGYPIVDAGMRELNATGYMHNRIRMVVASFLTKHLLIDWRWGERYFAAKLLDFELSSNNGGWQWAAGTGTDAQPYFRVFNPYSQQEKFDKELRYIRKWVPELETSRYPDPIVDHKAARQRAIDTYKKALG
ncbi:cryptochrome/photolyase family protein [Marinoscillum furvescens]|uniref:Deoxyribodipyrimidine photo-lyase n=1 Tax=Marinoscillum furvescens DSM 4134 TaxID=1122208 RepID=A0A3D9LKE3_MARFU|nr:deoxyribodipyrimidine photo-lyase [Marinoscillum furvescens]REE05712.1 deoxyribodipyrimidine photo-lyase [Marinoscillum furvescens DSM 4134]